MLGGMGGLIGSFFGGVGEEVVNAIWDGLIKWMLQNFYDTLADVFTQIGAMGAEIFDLTWISSSVRLFTMLGWTLFGVGMIVAAFDLALEYQTGRANIKSTAINVLKGFFAANLVTVVPVELYKFCISLQNIFLKDIAASFVGTTDFNLGDVALKVLVQVFGGPAGAVANGIFPLCMLIGMSYSVLKVFFANIKRGGMIFHKYLYFLIESRKHMRRHIQHITAYTHGGQIFRNLQTDKTAAHYNGLLDPACFHCCTKADRIIGCSHKEYLMCPLTGLRR